MRTYWKIWWIATVFNMISLFCILLGIQPLNFVFVTVAIILYSAGMILSYYKVIE
jgi:hypothetical protein